MTQIPTIRTARLVLRPQALDDFEPYAAMWSEPEVLRYTQRVAPAPELMWARFLRNAGFWTYLDFGMFTVEEAGTGRFVGQAGFFDARREIEPSLTGLLEAGWTLAEAGRGRGYGGEVVEALVGWGSERFAGREAVAIIDPANAPSRRLAERNGFELTESTTYRGDAINLFRRHL